MIGCFPTPYPDELLYSVYARLSQRLQYPDTKDFIATLFGSRHLASMIDLPSRLSNIIVSLPAGHPYTIEGFINNHTLLPYYRPFLTPKLLHRVWDDMCGDGGHHIHHRIGLTGNGVLVPSPQTLRYCSLCAVEDRDQFGECYWHRLHQVPGVEVCPVHCVALEQSDVSAHNAWNKWTFVTAEESIHPSLPYQFDLHKSDYATLLAIANASFWLLNTYNEPLQPLKLRQQYIIELSNRGYFQKDIKEDVLVLLGVFRNYFSSTILSILHCDFDLCKRQNWLIRLLYDPLRLTHPLHHLLMIQFLGLAIEDVFCFSTAYQPFGHGPWPCLNAASDHFRELRITECQLSCSTTNCSFVGTFVCNCGYTYEHFKPCGSVSEDIGRVRVKSYGPIWENKLRELWRDATLSMPDLADRLGVHKDIVRMYGFRLKLPFPRPGR